MSVFIQPQFIDSTVAAYHTNTSSKIERIDSFVARNNDTNLQTLSVYVVPSGGAPATSNLMLLVSIVPGATYRCPEIVGMDLGAGDSIWLVASLLGVVTVRANGRPVAA